MIHNHSDSPMLFSSPDGHSGSGSPHSPEVVLLISIAAGICSLVTVLGNTIVIMSFFINKSLRNFSNYMILSLALSDLTIGAFSMNVFTTYNVNQKWILGSAMCKAWLSVDYTASNASVMNLLVICVDRYLAITKPVKYKRLCTPSHAAVAILFVWLLSFLMWVPPITLWDVVSKNATLEEGECYIPFINESPALSVATIIGAFYFPAILMCLLYQRVIHQIKHRRSGIRSIIRDATTQETKAKKKRRMKIFRKCKQKTSSEDDEAMMKASSSGSNPITIPISDNPAAQGNCDGPKAANKKNVLLELSDISSASSPSVKSRISNSDYSKDEEMDRLRVTLNESYKPKPKPVYCQRSLQTPDSNTPPISKLTPSYEISGRAMSRFSSPDQSTRMLLTREKKRKENYRSHREHRVTVLLKFILLCFIFLWLPYSLTVVVAALCDQCVPAVVWNLSYWLCYLNSTVNPFCYGLCNENFRRTFKAIVTTRWWTQESRKILRAGRRTMHPNTHILKKGSLLKNTDKCRK